MGAAVRTSHGQSRGIGADGETVLAGGSRHVLGDVVSQRVEQSWLVYQPLKPSWCRSAMPRYLSGIGERKKDARSSLLRVFRKRLHSLACLRLDSLAAGLTRSSLPADTDVFGVRIESRPRRASVRESIQQLLLSSANGLGEKACSRPIEDRQQMPR